MILSGDRGAVTRAAAPYWLAAQAGGEPVGTATWNAFVHVLGAAGVVALLVVPRLERWVDHQVTGG